MKNIAIFGSTGSIGKQTIDVVLEYPHLYKIKFLSANNNIKELSKQIAIFNPQYVCVSNKENYTKLAEQIGAGTTKILMIDDFSVDILKKCHIDISVIAIPGFAGLGPTIEALKLGKKVALANKESLVVAGNIIMNLATEYNTTLVPVDSEHSAIFQCLVGEQKNSVEKIFLSCSGGPFLGKSLVEIDSCSNNKVSIQHPVWAMGRGITIDSATLMNKAFEIIEAKWLFNLCAEQIECVIHPECVIHSSVLFNDGSLKAQFGFPDMKVPIRYALSYPVRTFTSNKKFSFANISKLNFYKPDKFTFKSLNLAYESLERGGNIACALNAANEVARELFYNNKINLSQFYELIQETINNTQFISLPSYEDYISTDKQVKALCYNIFNKKNTCLNK